MIERDILRLADFSPFPSGRDANDGDFNGSRYRDEILYPAFVKAVSRGARLEVSLEGVLTYGTSFFDEAFGGLVRKRGLQKSQVKKNLIITPRGVRFDRYINMIERLVDRAGAV